jgi:EAL domain-containing protein (putative c-di-GMP-specific phosphodiesterase class I)
MKTNVPVAPYRAALQRGLDRAHFVPFYQPIVALATAEIVGMEVLARWNHPERGLLTPDRFIPLMEAELLCAELSLCLLAQVIADAGAWPAHWSFAFNVSAAQLRELPDFVGRAAAGLMDPRRIELEVTETVPIADMDLACAVMDAVHRGGARMVLDDFGTGYANFRQVRALPFDRIKIDRGFVTGLVTDVRTQACVAAMVGLAHGLDATVTAEGVVDEVTVRKLRDMGCDFAQGFHYAPPVPAAAVAGLAWRAAAA